MPRDGEASHRLSWCRCGALPVPRLLIAPDAGPTSQQHRGSIRPATAHRCGLCLAQSMQPLCPMMQPRCPMPHVPARALFERKDSLIIELGTSQVRQSCHARCQLDSVTCHRSTPGTSGHIRVCPRFRGHERRLLVRRSAGPKRHRVPPPQIGDRASSAYSQHLLPVRKHSARKQK